MPFEDITCGRCKKTITVFTDKKDNITEGFFDLTDPDFSKYAMPGEKETLVFNECMNKDEKYKIDMDE